MECGYTTASLRERIYSRDPGKEEAMAGVLIYTAAPTAKAPLGGAGLARRTQFWSGTWTRPSMPCGYVPATRSVQSIAR